MAKPYPNQFITTVLKISSERFSIYYSVAFCSELFGRFVHRFSSSKVRSFLEINTLTLLFFLNNVVKRVYCQTIPNSIHDNGIEN